MTITFIDSGVFVTASRGVENLSDKAITILSSADREFASSEFIKLEVLLYRVTEIGVVSLFK